MAFWAPSGAVNSPSLEVYDTLLLLGLEELPRPFPFDVLISLVGGGVVMELDVCVCPFLSLSWVGCVALKSGSQAKYANSFSPARNVPKPQVLVLLEPGDGE